MANKLALTTALFLALFAFATATRYTTIVTATTFDEEGDTPNPSGYQQCRSRQQYQGKQFISCQKAIGTVVIPGGQGGQQNDEPLLIEMVNGDETSSAAAARAGQILKECCDDLRQVEPECRCEAINHVARQVSQGMEKYKQQMPKGPEWEEHYKDLKRVMLDKASYLPHLCNFRKPRQCQIREGRSILF